MLLTSCLCIGSSLGLRCRAFVQIVCTCPWRLSLDNFCMASSPRHLVVSVPDGVKEYDSQLSLWEWHPVEMWCAVCMTGSGPPTPCPPAHLSCVLPKPREEIFYLSVLIIYRKSFLLDHVFLKEEYGLCFHVSITSQAPMWVGAQEESLRDAPSSVYFRYSSLGIDDSQFSRKVWKVTRALGW